MQARQQYAKSVLAIDGINDLAGIAINLNSIRSPIKPRVESSSIQELISASISRFSPLLPRLVLCPQGPHEILRLIAGNGIDLLMDAWSTDLSTIGVALNFCFSMRNDPESVQEDSKVKKQCDLGINLFSDSYASDFATLASSDLRTRLVKAYSPEALGDEPTRAYVHHLLHTHEMTSHVLLAMHNTCVMDLFMAGIRDSIRNGTFQRHKEAFEDVYMEKMQCETEAREAWRKVHRERGKGRLKGLGQERRDEPAVPLVSALESVGELESLSFEDEQQD